MFGTFEGISTSRGYALIENEVVSYSAITPGASGTGTLTIDGRALNDSVKSTHNKGATIRSYEVNGVSLMRKTDLMIYQELPIVMIIQILIVTISSLIEL